MTARPIAEPAISAKPEQRSLLRPVSRQPRCLPHQLHGVKLRWLLTVDNGCGDIRRQPGKTQEVNRTGQNPLGLYPAYRLYENNTYEQLADRFGLDKLYILSAGWGLISAGFLTPYYDITFSPSAEAYKRRRKADRYHDFCMLPLSTDEPIIFFGGKDYVPLFCTLTKSLKGERTVFYNSAQPPVAAGCILKRFATTTKINWHYGCAKSFLGGQAKP